MSRRWSGIDTRPPRGLTREQAAIWTVVHEAFGAVWLSLELANRLLTQRNPIDQIVKKLAKPKRLSKRGNLSAEQMAVGELMCAAVREYSESCYCAGWYSDIEHELWDEAILRKEDDYERTCVRLRKLAGTGTWRRPRKCSLFAEGLKLLSDRFGIWFVYEDGKGEKAILLKDWLPIHQAWVQNGILKRQPYEKVWEFAHWDALKKPKRIPSMPKIKLPQYRHQNEL